MERNSKVITTSGILLTVLGLMVITGWLLHISALTAILNNSTNMVFNVAINFTLTGLIILSLQKQTPIFQRLIPSILAGIIFTISLLTLCEYLLDYPIGIDELIIRVNFKDINPHPGRMPLNTTICFLLTSIIFLTLPFGKNKTVAGFIQAAIFVIFLLGFSVAISYLLNISFLYGTYNFNTMAVHTAFGMVILSLSLIAVWDQQAYINNFYEGKETSRILLVSVFLFFLATYTVALSVVAIVNKDTEKLLQNALSQSLQNRIVMFQNAIDRAVHSFEILLTSTQDILNTDKTINDENKLNLKNYNFSYINIYNPLHQSLFQYKTPIDKAAISIPVKTPYTTEIFWQNGWYIQFTSQIKKNNKIFGILTAQLPLTELNALITNYKEFGNTEEIVICGSTDLINAKCFPTRLTPQPFNLNLHPKEQAMPFPMFFALSGQQGIMHSLDYRRKMVIAAYSPLNSLGLGIVKKIDMVELYQPIRTQLRHILIIILATVFAGILFVYLLLRPLLQRIVVSEKFAALQKSLLIATESRMHAIMENSAEGIITLNDKGIIMSFNKKAEYIFGYTAGEIINQSINKLIAKKSFSAEDETMSNYLFMNTVPNWNNEMIEVTGLRKNGQEFPLELSLSEVEYQKQRIFSGIFRDISQRKIMEQKIIESEQRFYSAFEYATIGMALVSLEGRWLKVNEALCKITGYTEEELLKTNFQALTYEADLESDLDNIKKLIAGKIDNYQMEKRYYHKKGHLIWIALSVSLIRNEKNKPLYFISQVLDITKQKQSEEQLIYQAHHDLLTGLANRTFLDKELETEIASANQDKTVFAILFMDLDYFKEINDQYGHTTGDQLLKHIAKCLRQCTRTTDLIARLGGDEFVVLLRDVENVNNVITPAKKIIENVLKPVIINHHELYSTASIGISLFPHDGTDADTLLKNADIALYRAKQAGRNNFQFASPEIVNASLKNT